MTRRERLELKAEKRREWAESRRKKAAARFAASHAIVGQIPMGQPILVGHHSERRHRRDIERSHNHMAAGCESQKMAEHHESKADGLQTQLERSIFSDDADAIEKLEAKAAELDAAAENCNAINKAWRKHKDDEPALFAAWQALGVSEAHCVLLLKNAKEYTWTRARGPMDAKYDRANARRARQRIEEIKARNARTQAAEDAGGMTVTYTGESKCVCGCDRSWHGGREGATHCTLHPDKCTAYQSDGRRPYCTVTFAEKPARPILEALKAAGFYWGAGSWRGLSEKLPQCVIDLKPENATPND